MSNVFFDKRVKGDLSYLITTAYMSFISLIDRYFYPSQTVA
jgi:hypothetical protein